MIHPGERIEPKVLRQFARLGSPALREVTVAWQGPAAKLQAPRTPGAVFDGETLLVYARLEGATRGSATLSGVLDGKKVSWTVPLDPAGVPEGSLLATLAARAAIRDLEEAVGEAHQEGRGSRQRDRRDERARKEILRLATAYALASSETSFVAVEVREGQEHLPAAELRRVPVALTHGWGGIEMADGALGSQVVMERLADSIIIRRPTLQRRIEEANEGWVYGRSLIRVGTIDRSAPATRRHLEIARLQRADGSWAPSEALARIFGIEEGRLEDLAARFAVHPVVVATVAALVFLRTRCADTREEWRPLADKASDWFESAIGGKPSADLEIAVDDLLL